MSQDSNLIRILVIDDDEDDFFITSEYIKKISDIDTKILEQIIKESIVAIKNRLPQNKA